MSTYPWYVQGWTPGHSVTLRPVWAALNLFLIFKAVYI